MKLYPSSNFRGSRLGGFEDQPNRSYTVVTAPQITARDFHRDHLDGDTPALFPGLAKSWLACGLWSARYFADHAPNMIVPVKTYRQGGVDVQRMPISDYARLIEDAGDLPAGAQPYCHDVALFELIPGLVDQCSFDAQFLPAWYRAGWWRYAQFFIGPKFSLTPLHFDTLMTHNLFFQITGRKRFTLYPMGDAIRCGRRGWRWFDLDPEAPDTRRFPLAVDTQPIQVDLNAGDVLYLPPGTLHHVRGLEVSVSFNIDFHTPKSVLNALMHAKEGMPLESIYYNAITALGVVCGVPSSILFGAYRRYLSYIS